MVDITGYKAEEAMGRVFSFPFLLVITAGQSRSKAAFHHRRQFGKQHLANAVADFLAVHVSRNCSNASVLKAHFGLTQLPCYALTHRRTLLLWYILGP